MASGGYGYELADCHRVGVGWSLNRALLVVLR